MCTGKDKHGQQSKFATYAPLFKDKIIHFIFIKTLKQIYAVKLLDNISARTLLLPEMCLITNLYSWSIRLHLSSRIL